MCRFLFSVMQSEKERERERETSIKTQADMTVAFSIHTMLGCKDSPGKRFINAYTQPYISNW